MTVGLNVKIENEAGKTIVRIDGRLDAASAPILENKLNELIAGEKKQIVLDFAKVDYLSSAGMRLLLSTTKKLNLNQGKLHFCCVNEDVMEIIKMAGFERILSIFPTEKEALKAF